MLQLAFISIKVLMERKRMNENLKKKKKNMTKIQKSFPLYVINITIRQQTTRIKDDYLFTSFK